MSPTIIVLGVLGLIPFVACGLAAVGHNPEPAERMLAALIDYSALVLTFSGGAHWGLALLSGGMDQRAHRGRLALGVLPMLVGWVALGVRSLAPWMALTVLIVGFIGLLVGEREADRRGLLPPGYLWLRLGFTVVAVAMLTTVLTLRLLGQTIVF